MAELFWEIAEKLLGTNYIYIVGVAMVITMFILCVTTIACAILTIIEEGE